MEQALIDLAEKPRELFELLRRIHTHYCKEVEAWCKTDVDAVSFMDDWGTQKSLMASPDVFRTIFKPMYREYAEIAHRYEKFIFMHSDGWITDIIGDLVEIGIDALNSQVFCMGIKELGEKYRGRITFWGEIDRQNLLSRGTKEEIKRAVHEVYESLHASGGVIAQCEFGPGAKPENVMAVFETWDALVCPKSR
jgi:uroporphyrinogen-III decarboxylase